MKMTGISEYDVQPGQLIEWRLHPATIAAGRRSAHDPRPPSYLQEAHVRAAALQRDIGSEAPTWLGTAFDIPGALDCDALETALLQWITRHETLRSGLRLAGDRLERFTLRPEQVALDRRVVKHFSCSAALATYLERRFDDAVNPLTWPPYLFVTVARDDAFTVYLALDHSNVDGYSILQTPHEIHELYAAARDGRRAKLAKVGSYVDFSQIERDRADDLDANHESLVRWRDFVETCGGALPGFPLDLDMRAGDMPMQTAVREPLLDRADAAAFDVACRRAGGGILPGVLAVAGIVAYQRGGQPVYRTVIPLHTRSGQLWSRSLGWYIALAPIEIATAQAQDFRELMRIARDAVAAAKSVAHVPFPKVCALLDAELCATSMISYIDCRMVPGARHWGEWKAHAFGKVIYGDEVYLWINRTLDGLDVTCRYPRTELAHKNITGFISDARGVLTSVARSGSYSYASDCRARPAAA
jgi:mycolipenoyl-CoA---2-(long-chain-fatty acyl)-trehalose mycolipenoyltransferase / long-chain-acyl-CoA---trehalose acyltransferase